MTGRNSTHGPQFPRTAQQLLKKKKWTEQIISSPSPTSICTSTYKIFERSHKYWPLSTSKYVSEKNTTTFTDLNNYLQINIYVAKYMIQEISFYRQFYFTGTLMTKLHIAIHSSTKRMFAFVFSGFCQSFIYLDTIFPMVHVVISFWTSVPLYTHLFLLGVQVTLKCIMSWTMYVLNSDIDTSIYSYVLSTLL